MTQNSWQQETDNLIEWMKESPGSLDEVVDIDTGGLFPVESSWMEAVELLDTVELDDVLERLREPLLEGDLYRAARVALFCGSFVERGADPEILVDVMVAMLEARLVQSVQMVVEVEDGLDLESPDDLPEPLLERFWLQHPDWLKGWRSLGFVVLPAMTMLARSLPARQRARNNEDLLDLVDAMDEVHGVIYYLSELLFMVDDEEFLVLVPENKVGVRVRAEAVRNNFHLFTLLQQALLNGPDGPLLWADPPDPALGSIARGEVHLEESMMDRALWDYCHWTCLAQTRPAAIPDPAEHVIWGEASPRTIRECRDTRVLVLQPLQTERTWDANFFAPLHDALRSDVEVLEILSPVEVSEWLDHLAAQTWTPHDELSASDSLQ